MRIMIASDLHGSFECGKELLLRFEEEKCEKLLLLGDLLYHGARNDLPGGYDTKALTAHLNHYKDRILAVRGNCDAEIDQTVLEFPIMSDFLTLFVDGREWIATHGHIFNEDRMMPHSSGAVLLHGHTHLKVTEKRDDFYYVNPGSVSIPKDDAFGSYMVYENNRFTLKKLSGEALRVFELN